MTQETTRSDGTSVEDRQRDRMARGVRSRASAMAGNTDRPSPPRRRRPAMAALAVLLIVGGAALAGLLALRVDSRDPVLLLNTDVPAGTQISADMLSTTPVASEGLMLVPEDQANEVLGTYARSPLTRGQLLDTSMLTGTNPFGEDTAQVGVPLSPGKVPDGLRSGDEVRIVRVGDGTTPARPLAVGLVLSSSAADGAGGISGGSQDGSATVLVPLQAADQVVDASGRKLLGMSLVRRGVAFDDADLQVIEPTPAAGGSSG